MTTALNRFFFVFTHESHTYRSKLAQKSQLDLVSIYVMAASMFQTQPTCILVTTSMIPSFRFRKESENESKSKYLTKCWFDLKRWVSVTQVHSILWSQSQSQSQSSVFQLILSKWFWVGSIVNVFLILWTAPCDINQQYASNCCSITQWTQPNRTQSVNFNSMSLKSSCFGDKLCDYYTQRLNSRIHMIAFSSFIYSFFLSCVRFFGHIYGHNLSFFFLFLSLFLICFQYLCLSHIFDIFSNLFVETLFFSFLH